MQLIPAIDLRAGRCVRLLKGDFERETRYEIDPAALLADYRRQGAEWVHVVDLDAARDGDASNRRIIAALAAAGGRLQVGGGLRDRGDAAAVLGLGVSRVVIGSAAVTNVQGVRGWLGELGAERVTLAFDVRLGDDGVPRVTTHGWKRQSPLTLWDAVAAYRDTGLTHVLCTDVDRDGALAGPNLALYEEAVRRHPEIRWQASGGVRSADDLAALAHAGAAAAVSGKALLDGLIAWEELQPYLRNA